VQAFTFPLCLFSTDVPHLRLVWTNLRGSSKHVMDQHGDKKRNRTDNALTSLLTALPFPQRRNNKAQAQRAIPAPSSTGDVHVDNHERKTSHQSAGPSLHTEVQPALRVPCVKGSAFGWCQSNLPAIHVYLSGCGPQDHVHALRKQHRIHVKGTDIPAPLLVNFCGFLLILLL
jgi:hypothetical protein